MARRKAATTAVVPAPKRAVRWGSRRGPMPAEIRDATDRLAPAVWLSRRIRRFGPLVQHPMFPEVYSRLQRRESAYSVAKWMHATLPHDDPLGVDNVGTDALELRLNRFIRCLPPSVFDPLTEIDREFKRPGVLLDVAAEFDALIRLQKHRLAKGLAREKEMPLPLEQVRREIETLGHLLFERQGFGAAVGQQVNVNIGGQHLTVQGGGALEAVRSFTQRDPNKTLAVLEIMDALDEADVIEGEVVGGDPAPAD